MTLVPAEYGNLSRMLKTQLMVFPKHEKFLASRFEPADNSNLAFSDEIASLVLKIADPSVEAVCEDYRWLTHTLLEEEMYFRRHGKYRLSKFADALAQVYSNPVYMRRYMNGVLASQVWWHNHTEVMRIFRDVFIARNPHGFSHLEIGPGHGLYLHLAASAPHCSFAEGWDVSATSIASTKAAIERMGASDKIALHLFNAFSDSEPDRKFDSVTCSEVIEHLEDPAHALRVMGNLLAPGGRLFINAPVNSPAPDHIYLFRTPEEVVDLIRGVGFDIQETYFIPITGATLDRARRQELTISAVVIATRQG
jgi:2-polyprenyl-3-methyl-5-hydroxy-6-metoxy-1,4-benzoquinol methylase